MHWLLWVHCWVHKPGWAAQACPHLCGRWLLGRASPWCTTCHCRGWLSALSPNCPSIEMSRVQARLGPVPEAPEGGLPCCPRCGPPCWPPRKLGSPSPLSPYPPHAKELPARNPCEPQAQQGVAWVDARFVDCK